MEISEKDRVNIKNNMSQHVFKVKYIFTEDIKNESGNIIAQNGDAIIINENDELDRRVFHVTQLLKI